MLASPRRTAQTPYLFIRKILVPVKFFVRNSGAGIAAPILWYGRLEKWVLSAGNPMSIKFLVFGGGGYWGFFGSRSADFIFMGARIFLSIEGG